MTVQKVIPEDKSPKQNEELDYDVWIDINIKNICKKERGRVEYVSRKNGQPNKYDTEKIVTELKKLDLADANALTATLTRKGEEVCKAGGWIEYIKQQENQSSFFESSNNSGKIQKRNNKKTIIGAIIHAIVSLSPIWKIIIGIMVAGLGTLLGYILIEWYKNFHSV